MGCSPLCHDFTFLHLLFLLTTFYSIVIYNVDALSSLQQPLCHDDESSALMQFKESVFIQKFASDDPSAYPKVASWKLEAGERNTTNSNMTDCCLWDGVTCDEDTGHVIGLDLSSSSLYGSINSSSSLFHLVHLHRLNLGDNNFNQSHIPSSVGRLSRLTHLNLSSASFTGHIPLQIFSKLTKLASLDLSTNHFVGQIIPTTFDNLTLLVHLDLCYNNFKGQIPSSIGNLTQLTYLDLSRNNFMGQIPYWLTNMTQLRELDLSKNLLQGPIPESISQLSNLEFLSVAFNNLSGTVKLDVFLTFKNLTSLRLAYNQLTLLTSSSIKGGNATLIIPKFKFLGLSACNLTEFPDFLCNQNDLQLLGLADNRIGGLMPKWLWNMSTETLLVMDVSSNFLTGFDHPPLVLPWSRLLILNLDSNMLQGSLPTPPLSTILYTVSNNKLNGEISQLICNTSSLYALDLSYNYLSGIIPQCLGSSTDSLSILNLRNNNLRGPIPQIYKRGSKLKMIDLSQNQLHGMVPTSLVNCSFLESLNLEDNQINDIFPFWLGGTLSQLKILILRFNRFHGAIRHPESSFAPFPKLRVIDLSHNGFTGELPSNYFRAMKVVDHDQSYLQAIIDLTIFNWFDNYHYSMTITNKGVQTTYLKILNIFTVIDLSSNQFQGKIPESIGILKGLHVLNLSNNNLIGHIPSSLGNLTQLESLDLSQNKLSGEIPQKLTQLTFLEFFNVSYNHLTGPIPRGRQFDTFPNSSYEGNSRLCGDPLSKKCGNLQAPPPPPPPPPSKFKQDDDHSWFPIDKTDWIVISMGYGGGLIDGLIIGHTLTTRYHEWFVSTFGRNQKKPRKKNKSGLRS